PRHGRQQQQAVSVAPCDLLLQAAIRRWLPPAAIRPDRRGGGQSLSRHGGVRQRRSALHSQVSVADSHAAERSTETAESSYRPAATDRADAATFGTDGSSCCPAYQGCGTEINLQHRGRMFRAAVTVNRFLNGHVYQI